MEDSVQPIGKVEWGSLTVPAEYMVRDDEGFILRIKIIKETALTVYVRKFILNSRNGDKYRDDYYRKSDKIDVLERLEEEDLTMDEDGE